MADVDFDSIADNATMDYPKDTFPERRVVEAVKQFVESDCSSELQALKTAKGAVEKMSKRPLRHWRRVKIRTERLALMLLQSG